MRMRPLTVTWLLSCSSVKTWLKVNKQDLCLSDWLSIIYRRPQLKHRKAILEKEVPPRRCEFHGFHMTSNLTKLRLSVWLTLRLLSSFHMESCVTFSYSRYKISFCLSMLSLYIIIWGCPKLMVFLSVLDDPMLQFLLNLNVYVCLECQSSKKCIVVVVIHDQYML